MRGAESLILLNLVALHLQVSTWVASEARDADGLQLGRGEAREGLASQCPVTGSPH